MDTYLLSFFKWDDITLFLTLEDIKDWKMLHDHWEEAEQTGNKRFFESPLLFEYHTKEIENSHFMFNNFVNHFYDWLFANRGEFEFKLTWFGFWSSLLNEINIKFRVNVPHYKEDQNKSFVSNSTSTSLKSTTIHSPSFSLELELF